MGGIKDKTKENREPLFTDVYLRGLMARIFQHEIDHLDGIVNWDKEFEDKERKIIDMIHLAKLEKPSDMEKWTNENEDKLLIY